MPDIPTPQAVRQAAARFAPQEKILGIHRNDAGHINDTYALTLAAPAGRIILQRVNTTVFTQPVQLMENMVRITDFLRRRLAEAGGDPDRETLRPLPDADGGYLYWDADGAPWRAFPYIEGTVTHQRVTDAAQLYEAGCAFGRFQCLLDGFPAGVLHEVIPRFHDTARRCRALQDAEAADPIGRAASVRRELAFAGERFASAGLLQTLLDTGELPLRVTHNDTKINNVLMDKDTGHAVCVIDLDIVMPGSLLFDFGDAIRSGVNTADEDERDLDRVRMDADCYRAFTQGFLRHIAGHLTPRERALLPVAARLMTYECGVRFLTDHINGDTYFHISRPGHNLDRARTQFHLLAQLETHETALTDMLEEILHQAAAE
ncbi:MAG: aminoglycoside phosphotransferase family protein [Oscillospiraceae bacterium]|jgi:Ser/Thr protein kinase RdoA (MazF antagonist)|nr:aminoglycoside phosphotransferase family protein [Oscillospiraceae bacterium]